MNRSLVFASICAGLLVAGCNEKSAAPVAAPAEAPPKTAGVPAPEVPAAAAPIAEPPPVPVAWQALETATFTIDVPGAAKMQEGIEKTQAGPVNTTTWSIQTGTAFYAVSIADYPKGMMAAAVPSKVLEGARDGAMANVGGKVDKDFTVFLESGVAKKKYPGREFDGVTNAGVKMAARLFLVDDRLYQMIAVSPVPQFNPEDFKKFADSFKLKPAAAAPAPAKAGKRKK
jgi:hypothetical protein